MQVAAALSYYTVFSIAPLLVIVIVVAGAFFGQAAVEGQIVEQFENVLGEETANLLLTMIEGFQNMESGIFAALVSIALLLFGATNLFFQLETALNTIWHIESEDGEGTFQSLLEMLQKRVLSFAFVLGLGVLLIVSLVVNSLLSAFVAYLETQVAGIGYILQATNILLSVTVITLMIAMVYKYLPDTHINWQDVWVGATVTSILFTVGQLAIGAYLGRSSVTSAYGAAGSLAALLLWVYYSMQILLLGAEFTQVYAHEIGSKKGIGSLAHTADVQE